MTNEEYRFLEEKYGKLIYKISHMVTGDVGSCSVSDNVQELWLAADTAIDGYKRQNDGANGTFDDFKDTKGFDKYIKTVLWNNKNKRGVKASKHKDFFEEIPVDESDKILDIPDDTVAPSSTFSPFSVVKLTAEEQQALDLMLEYPSMIKPSGGVDCTKLARKMNTYWKRAHHLVESIQAKMENAL